MMIFEYRVTKNENEHTVAVEAENEMDARRKVRNRHKDAVIILIKQRNANGSVIAF